MFSEDKVTEIFCLADEFCNFFDKMTAKYTLKSEKKPAIDVEVINDGQLSFF